MDTRSIEQPRGRGVNKRQWNKTEDAKLVEALLDLSGDSYWKGDNGFKDGYLTRLEKMLEEKLSGCGLKAKPHIESRVKLLKKQCNAITEMLDPRGSGFGWNSEEKYITADKDVFDAWVKSHSNAKGMLNKPFPHYDALAQVFGKDRATGEAAETAADVIEEIDREETININDITNENGQDEIDGSIPLTQSSSAANPFAGGPSNQHRRKRARASDSWLTGLTDIENKLGNLYEGANENIAKLASCFQFEADVAERRMKVFDEIQNIPDLTDMDRIKAGEIIVVDSHKVDYFFSLPSYFKKPWVMNLLEKIN